jgi:CubicO group peptidase (beta-lactamase class C family)
MQLRLIAVFALFLLTCVTPAHLRAQDHLEAGKERIRSIIRNALGKPPNLLPSAALAVVQDGKIIWEEAFGWADQERRIAATPTTPYNVASVTKAFTGMALAILANDGKIDMNRSVNAYLGSHKVRPALWDEKAITVQNVADHVGGLSTFGLGCDSPAPCKLESVIDRFGVIVRPAGATFNYSNLGFAILGDVIARASKRSYEDFLRRALFDPLGMRDCEVRADGKVRGAAVPYFYGTTKVEAAGYSATPAAGSAFCSAHSLGLFARALLDSQDSAPRSQGARQWSALLPTTGVPAEQTGTPSGTTYSRGWWIQQDYVGTPSVYAQGGSTGTGAMVRLIPAERLAVVVLGNTGSLWEFLIDRVVDEFVPAIGERRKTWTAPAPFTRQRRPMAPELVGTWVGAIDTYRGKRPLTITIDSAGAVTGTLRLNGADVALTNGASSGPRAFGLLPNVDLGVDEAKAGSYDVRLGLELYGTRLAGSATTEARPNSSAPQLSFLVELTSR